MKRKDIIEAFVEKTEAEKREPKEEQNVPLILVSYWKEKALSLANGDQTRRSLVTFIAFLSQDAVGVGAKIMDLTPALFERFRKWRMGPHDFEIEWFGNPKSYSSPGVAGSTVQRNINDIRAAVYHARDTLKIRMAPKIRNVEARYLPGPRNRILTEDELARIVWYA